MDFSLVHMWSSVPGVEEPMAFGCGPHHVLRSSVPGVEEPMAIGRGPHHIPQGKGPLLRLQ